MSTPLLDASAILALLQDEPGSDLVAQTLEAGATIVSVNLSEVAAKLVDAGLSQNDVSQLLEAFKFDVVVFDRDDALAAGLLRRQTRTRGLSLGDRACLAVALRRGGPVLTADGAWVGLVPEVDIVVIR